LGYPPPAPEAVEIGPPISGIFTPDTEFAPAWELVSQSGSGQSTMRSGSMLLKTSSIPFRTDHFEVSTIVSQHAFTWVEI